MLKKRHFNLDNAFFLSVAIIFAVLIIVQIMNVFKAVNKYIKAPAEIIQMESFYGNRGGYTEGVRIEYAVSNNIYKCDVEYCKSTWKKGDTITIYYNPYNVEEVVIIGEKTKKIFMYLFAEVIFIPPIFMWKKKRSLDDDIRLKKWIRALKNRREK